MPCTHHVHLTPQQHSSSGGGGAFLLLEVTQVMALTSFRVGDSSTLCFLCLGDRMEKEKPRSTISHPVAITRSSSCIFGPVTNTLIKSNFEEEVIYST